MSKDVGQSLSWHCIVEGGGGWGRELFLSIQDKGMVSLLNMSSIYKSFRISFPNEVFCHNSPVSLKCHFILYDAGLCSTMLGYIMLCYVDDDDDDDDDDD